MNDIKSNCNPDVILDELKERYNSFENELEEKHNEFIIKDMISSELANLEMHEYCNNDDIIDVEITAKFIFRKDVLICYVLIVLIVI